MAFDISWKSFAGYFTGDFVMPTNLYNITSDSAEPGAGSTSGFERWIPHDYDSTLIRTVEEYNNVQGKTFDQAMLLEYFYGSSLSNRKKLMEFKIENSSLAPSGGYVTFCIKAWLNGTNLTIVPYRIIYDNTATPISETECGTQSLMITNGRVKVVAGTFSRGLYPYVGAGFYSLGLNGGETNGIINYMTQVNFETFFGGQPTPHTDDPQYGPPSEPGGGYIPGGGLTPTGRTVEPTFDNTSDKIPISDPPQLSAFSSKLLHAYKTTTLELDKLAEALYPDTIFTAPDVLTALEGIWNTIFMNKWVDYILDLMILPIDVPATNVVNMRVGGKEVVTADGRIATHLVDQQWVEHTCGSLHIDEYWVNFLDFAGTKVKLFLPYVGYVDLQPEYIIGGTVYVDYRFNVVDGSFMCYVRSDSGYSELEESLIGQYSGVAAVHIPLQSADYSNKISGLISAIGSVAAGAASGGISAAAAAGAATNAANTIIQKPGTSHANGYNASSSFLSNRSPYVIIERQWSQFSEKYPEEVGIPSNVMCRIGDLTGLVKSQNAHLDVIPANKEVKEMISQLLADGIIVG